METACIMYCDIISSNDIIIKRTKWPRIGHLSFVLNVLSIGIYWKLATLLMTCLVIHVRSQSHKCNTFKCCLPADATHKLSGLYAWWFQTRRKVMFSLYVSQCKKEFMTRKSRCSIDSGTCYQVNRMSTQTWHVVGWVKRFFSGL